MATDAVIPDEVLKEGLKLARARSAQTRGWDDWALEVVAPATSARAPRATPGAAGDRLFGMGASDDGVPSLLRFAGGGRGVPARRAQDHDRQGGVVTNVCSSRLRLFIRSLGRSATASHGNREPTATSG